MTKQAGSNQHGTEEPLIRTINSIAETLLRTCKEAEIKVQHVLDKALKEKFDRKQTLDAVQEIIEDIMNSPSTFPVKIVVELFIGVFFASSEKSNERKEYLKQITCFNRELIAWSETMFSKIAEESFEGKIEKRNATSAFYRATIHAFQQSNLKDLMAAANTHASFVG